MKLARKHGSTSVILNIFIADSTSTSGAGLTGLVFNSAGLTAYYYRELATTPVAISLVTMTLGTFTSGGFKEIDATNMPGWYQFCPPNLAFDNGSYSVCFHLKGATNMVPLPIEIDLESQVSLTDIAGHEVTATGAVAFPNATLASTTNITAGTVTTVSGNVNGSVGSVVGAVASVSGNVGGNVTGSVGSVATGGISSASFAAGAITAAAIATGALTAAKFASDFFTAIAAGVWDALTSGISTVGSIGKLIVDNINVALSTLATATNLAAAKTVLDAVVLDTDELQQEWADGGRLDLILDARASQMSVDTAQGDLTTLTGRLTATRAGYLDKLNISGNVASQSDVLAINQSASRRILIQTVGQYERPETGDTSTYTIEVRTYDEDGAAVDADTTPTLTATGIISGSLSANLSVASNPSTGLYSWTYTVEPADEIEQIRFAVSATLNAAVFPLSTFAQVVDLVSETWTGDDRAKLVAIFNKLPSRSFLLGTAASTGAFTTADLGLASGDLDTKFSSLNTKVDTIDGIVDTILIDSNELQTDWTNGGRLDLILDACSTQVTSSAILADTNELQLDWTDGGRLDLILDARASQTSVNTLQTSVNDVPNNSEFNTAIGTITTAIAALNDLDATQIETIVTEVITDAALASASMLTTVQKMVEADVTIDKGVVPWAVVWKERGTATELLRKRLKDVDGGNITSVSTVIGQTVQ